MLLTRVSTLSSDLNGNLMQRRSTLIIVLLLICGPIVFGLLRSGGKTPTSRLPNNQGNEAISTNASEKLLNVRTVSVLTSPIDKGQTHAQATQAAAEYFKRHLETEGFAQALAKRYQATAEPVTVVLRSQPTIAVGDAVLQLNITSFNAKSFSPGDEEDEAFINYSLDYRARLHFKSDSDALLDSTGQINAAHFFPRGSKPSKSDAIAEAIRQNGKRVFEAVIGNLSDALKETR